MDDATFLGLINRIPFGSCGVAEWHALTERLLASLSQFLGVELEFVGNRRPDSDHFSPLVRSVKEFLPAIGVRLAGIMSCGTVNRASGLRIHALLFVFIGGKRVGPPSRQFIRYDYLGSGDGPDWVSQGWQTTDFSEEWNPYTFIRYFGGRESELPGCNAEAESSDELESGHNRQPEEDRHHT